jgi:diadenosine tetraphosphate (Ap4A) HIT family hydrolase
MICPFCENLNIKDREVIRNEYAWAFPTNIPIVPGHLLICPIRCVETIDESLTTVRARPCLLQ